MAAVFSRTAASFKAKDPGVSGKDAVLSEKAAGVRRRGTLLSDEEAFPKHEEPLSSDEEAFSRHEEPLRRHEEALLSVEPVPMSMIAGVLEKEGRGTRLANAALKPGRWAKSPVYTILSAAMQAFEARPPPLTMGTDGAVWVTGTRVSLETIVTAFDSGATAEEIAQQYPSVDLASVYGVISYVLGHRPEVDTYMRRRADHAAEVRAKIEAATPAEGFRARLLSRRSPPGAE